MKSNGNDEVHNDREETVRGGGGAGHRCAAALRLDPAWAEEYACGVKGYEKTDLSNFDVGCFGNIRLLCFYQVDNDTDFNCSWGGRQNPKIRQRGRRFQKAIKHFHLARLRGRNTRVLSALWRFSGHKQKPEGNV
jgi:hypothetical protein